MHLLHLLRLFARPPRSLVRGDSSSPSSSFYVLDQLRHRNQFCDGVIKLEGAQLPDVRSVIVFSTDIYYVCCISTSVRHRSRSSSYWKLTILITLPVNYTCTQRYYVVYIYPQATHCQDIAGKSSKLSTTSMHKFIHIRSTEARTLIGIIVQV